MVIHDMRIAFGETKVSVAVPNSPSVKTTIPAHVAAQLKLQSKDSVRWELDKVDGVWIAIIRKV